MARVLYGDAGGNKIFATANKMQLYGLAGNDTLVSEGNNDVILIGGSGNDSLIIKDGTGTLSGGAGNDTFAFHYSATETLSAVIEDLNPQDDKIVVNFDGTTAPQLKSSVKGNDVVLRDGDGYFNVTLNSVRDNDYFDGTALDEVWEVLHFTNDEREKENLPALTLSKGLIAGASIRAEEITNLGQTGALNDHTRPNGSQWYTVLDGKYNYPGENLDGGAESPAQVLYDWMHSESHKKNILDKNFRKLGVGYNYFDIDESDHRWYWVQLFADSLKATETVSTNELSTASPEINAAQKFFTLTENPDTYTNSAFGATVDALGGGDFITNTNSAVSISGGADSDTIDNSGSYVVINAGTGEDSIRLSNDAELVYFQYAIGDGNDTISGFNDTSMLLISSDDYIPVTVGNDVVVAVGSDSITLTDATKSVVFILGTKTALAIGTKDADYLYNDVFDSIDGGAGNDTIKNYISNATITGGDGNDTIYSHIGISSISIDGGSGDDSISNHGANITITSGDGNDTIHNGSSGSSVNIDSGTGDDTIANHGSEVTIDGGAGDDSIKNFSSEVIISSGGGNDAILSGGGKVTINTGNGNDQIILSSDNQNNMIQYTAGDGNDTIQGFNETDTLSISGSEYTSATIGNNIVLEVGTNHILLLDVENLDAVNIVGTKSNQNKLITLTEGDDPYNNTELGVVINALGGNDSINNTSSFEIINGDADNDIIENESSYVLIDGGTGNDSVNNNGEYVTITGSAGNDLFYNYDGDHSTLSGSAGKDTIYNGYSWWVSIVGGAGDDSIVNENGDYSTLSGGTGDDIIDLTSSTEMNLIEYTLGDGNDTISGFNETDTLNISESEYTSSKSVNDVVVNVGTNSIKLLNAATLSSVKIMTTKDGGKIVTLTEGDDTYNNSIEAATIAALDGNDVIYNSSRNSNVSISGGMGNDSISNHSSNAVLEGNDGDDTINSYGGSFSKLDGGDGHDYIANGINADDYSYGDNSTIVGGSGNDYISNHGSEVTITSGDGNDYISSDSGISSVSIDDGAGDDTITNHSSEVTISGGDGNDTIWGFKENDTMNILAESYSTIGDGNDKIILVGSGSIRLVNAREKPVHIVIGESNPSGGKGDDGGKDSSSSGRGDGGRGGNDSGGNTSGGSAGNQTSTGISGGGKSQSIQRNDRNATDNQSTPNSYLHIPNCLHRWQPGYRQLPIGRQNYFRCAIHRSILRRRGEFLCRLVDRCARDSKRV